MRCDSVILYCFYDSCRTGRGSPYGLANGGSDGSSHGGPDGGAYTDPYAYADAYTDPYAETDPHADAETNDSTDVPADGYGFAFRGAE